MEGAFFFGSEVLPSADCELHTLWYLGLIAAVRLGLFAKLHNVQSSDNFTQPYHVVLQRGAGVKLVPWDHDVSREHFDGLFISNGPGDPSLAEAAVHNLRKVRTQPKQQGSDMPIYQGRMQLK